MSFQAPYAYLRYAMFAFVGAAGFLFMSLSDSLTISEHTQHHNFWYVGLGFIAIGIIHLVVYFVYVKSIDSDGIKRSYSRKAFYANDVSPETFRRIQHVYNNHIAKIERIKGIVVLILIGIGFAVYALFSPNDIRINDKDKVAIGSIVLIFIVVGILRLIFRRKNKHASDANLFGGTYYVSENQNQPIQSYQPFHYEYSPKKQSEKLNIFLILFSIVVITLLWIALYLGGFSAVSVILGVILTACIIAFSAVFNFRSQDKQKKVIHSDM